MQSSCKHINKRGDPVSPRFEYCLDCGVTLVFGKVPKKKLTHYKIIKNHHPSEACKHTPSRSYIQGIPVMSCTKCFITLGAIAYSPKKKRGKNA